MSEIQMFLDDPQKSVVLGLPATALSPVQSNNNPFYAALELDRTGDHKGAERLYLELLNNDFGNPAVMAALGMNYASAEKNGLAFLLLTNALPLTDTLVDAYKRLGITPKPGVGSSISDFLKAKRAEILNCIGTCHKHENHTEEARHWFELAQRDIPTNPDVQNNLGTLYINEGKPQLALPHLDTAILHNPQHAQAHWNRSLAYLELGDYAQGWPEYDWGLEGKVRVDRNYTANGAPTLPVWQKEPGANIVVYGEQGIGDEILFASMLPDLLRDAKSVVFECHRKLHSLFANSFPGIDIYPTREDPVITWPLVGKENLPRHPFTHKVALGSLGRFYRNSLSDFPGTAYLSPTPASELRWNEALAQLPPGPRIGISWIGGHKRTRIEVRSLELEALLPILRQDAQFVSLQYTPHEAEVEAFEKKHGIKIHVFPEAVYSAQYDDTAGLVANLDLVISVCTSVVHLAGALDVPTWVLVPSRPAWRYRLDLDTMPWYGCTTLFRQAPDSSDWTPVIAEVASELAGLLSTIQPKFANAK